MESRSSAVLGSGDWVMYDGGEHQVVALAGTSVRLRSAGGTDTVVLAAYLMASPGSAVVDGASAPTVEPFGLLDALPDAVIDAARVWEQYVVEVQTGLPPGAVVGAAPRPGYDPATTTVTQRDQGKAAELGGQRSHGAAGPRSLRPAGSVGAGGSVRGAGMGGDRSR